MTIITRFAPSPTGKLHIGSARTAVVNAVVAQQQQGQFRLRIEDTDQQRSTAEAAEQILSGLGWLGLRHDGDVIWQRQNQAEHRRAAEILLATGRAYRCYCDKQELEQKRAEAKAKQQVYRYDGQWRDRAPLGEGHPYSIRLKRDLRQNVAFTDLIQGRVEVKAQELDDFVLLRSDGTPTYMLAVVVDDHAIGVDTVIRGVDHLGNTARQIQLYQALDYPIPRFAHLPLMHDRQGAKLSKRTNPLGLDELKREGFLPEAVVVYLLQLGGGCDDSLTTQAAAIANFDLSRINRSAARFDLEKLRFLNKQMIQQLSVPALIERVRVFMPQPARSGVLAQRWQTAAASLQTRSATLEEFVCNARFFWQPPRWPLQEQEAADALKKADNTLLTQSLASLSACQPWSAESIQTTLRDITAQTGQKFGQIARPIRAAVCGTMRSPDLSLCLAALGQPEVLSRLQAAIGFVRSNSNP